MSNTKIRDENFYQIQGWMLNRLKLRGTQLNVYAIIYGFTQDGQTEFAGSLQYLCDFTGVSSKTTIQKALKELVDKQLITRLETTVNGVLVNKYSVNVNMLDNSLIPLDEGYNKNCGGITKTVGGITESVTGYNRNCVGGITDSVTNNNIYNNTDNNINNKKGKASKTRHSLFSTPNYNEKQTKENKFIQDAMNIAEEFEFSDLIMDNLHTFFQMLAQSHTFLPLISIRAQLEDIFDLTKNQQLVVITDTVKSGWKSLKYATDKIRQSPAPQFDTAKPGAFQPKDPNNDNRRQQYENDEVF